MSAQNFPSIHPTVDIFYLELVARKYTNKITKVSNLISAFLFSFLINFSTHHLQDVQCFILRFSPLWILLSSNLPIELLIFVVQFVYHSKGLQELSEVYTAVLVEVDASSQVIDGSVVDVDPQVGAEKTPRMTELLNGDQTWTWQQTIHPHT